MSITMPKSACALPRPSGRGGAVRVLVLKGVTVEIVERMRLKAATVKHLESANTATLRL